jgi:hypothetical protein
VSKIKVKDMKNQMIAKLLNGAIIVTAVAAMTQIAGAIPPGNLVPDAGSASVLMGVACAGLVAIRRFRR